MHIKEIDKFCVSTCLQLFCDLFWILVCNSYGSERSGKTVYGESISFFHGLYLPSQYTFSPQIITVIKVSICYVQ